MKVNATGGAITSTTPGSAGARAATHDRDGDDADGDDVDPTAPTKPTKPTTDAKPEPEPVRKPDSASSPASPTPKKPKRWLPAATASAQNTPTEPTAQRAVPQADDPAPPRVSVASEISVQRVAEPPADDPAPRRVSVASEISVQWVAEPPAQASVPTPEAPGPTVTRWASTMLSWAGLSPSASGDVPPLPGEWPVLLGLLAAGRRLSQQTLSGDASSLRTVDNAETSLILAPSGATGGEPMMALMTAAVNSAPTASPSLVGVADAATGAVTVDLNAVDSENNPLTYVVTSQPTDGTVSTSTAGVYKYVPTEAARLRASAATVDRFTVTVSDGQGGATAVQVSVPVSPTQVSSPTTVSTGTTSNPAGVVVRGTRAYVVNTLANSVSVYDTGNNYALVRTVPVGTSPTAIAVGADGSVWVANTGTNKVSRINTTTWAVTSITVESAPRSIAVSPTDGSVWVANSSSKSVSRINPVNNTVVTVNNVGTAPYAVSVAPDGWVWVANANSNNVARINPANNTVASRITVGPMPTSIVATNSRVFVVNQNGKTVSVIDRANNTVMATVSVGATPTSIALSRDASLAYVANSDDTLSIIDTKTNTVIGTPKVDLTSGPPGAHRIAVGPDGRLYVTDAQDKSLRILTLNRLNSAPLVGIPTVEIPDAAGVVAGTISAGDIDGDALSYAVAAQPTNGVAIVNTGTRAFTYTPTQAARDQAAQTPGSDVDTFTVAVSDGRGGITTASVTVPIAPTPPVDQIPVTVTPITVDTYPSAVAISGNDAYVYGGDVIWTIDTTTKTVTDQTALYNDPPAITPDGRMYVPNPNLYYQGNAPYDSVDVIDTATGSVIKNIPLPLCYDCYSAPSGPRDVVISPDGQRVYVSEDYYIDTGIASTTVTVIDTRTDTATGTFATSPLSDVEIASDGTIYGVSSEYPFVNVYNADMNQIAAFSLTSLGYYYWSPTGALALNGDKTRGYIVVQDYGYGQHVAVIDTEPASPTRNTEIAVITERNTALSPDGSRRYVAQADGKTVLVYDTASNTTIGSFVTDQNVGSSFRSIAVAADGTVYVTDMNDNKVYAVTVGGT